jgi:hypothetical protein
MLIGSGILDSGSGINITDLQPGTLQYIATIHGQFSQTFWTISPTQYLINLSLSHKFFKMIFSKKIFHRTHLNYLFLCMPAIFG